jgi:hypothetical protein
MPILTSGDVDLMQTISFSLKLGNMSILEYYKNRYENDKDPKKAFEYGLSLCTMLAIENFSRDRPLNFILAYRAFSEVISAEKDNWLARFIRLDLAIKMPNNMINISKDINSNNYDVFSYKDDYEAIIELQNRNSEKSVLFLCPYIIMAKKYVSNGDIVISRDTYKKGLILYPPARYPLRLELFSRPFYDLAFLYKKEGLSADFEIIKKSGKIIFPNNKLLQML